MNSVEEYYNTFYKKIAELDAKSNNFSKIEKFLPDLPNGAKILDIGCGFGTVSQELINRGFDVYGIEINRDAVIELKNKGFNVIEQDISQKFQPMNEQFDLILLLDVLEHVFDPLSLMIESQKLLSKNGKLIISVPLYFDIIDRFRILLTGNIISYDNKGYGKEIYNQFRSYNYDHIRFFRPADLLKMCSLSNLKVQKIQYTPFLGMGLVTKILRKTIGNPYLLKKMPGLLAHAMMIMAENS